MRSAVGVGAWRDHADALSLENRKRLDAEIENNVTDVAVGAFRGQPVVALHDGDRRFRARVQIDARLGSRGRRLGCAAGALMRLLDQGRDGIVKRFDDAGIRRPTPGEFLLRRQFRPTELIFKRIRRSYDTPIIDRSCRAWRDAIHTIVTFGGVNHDIVLVMGDRVDRTSLLARMAADADFRVDEMLFDERVHRSASARSLASRHVKPDIFEITGLVVDAYSRRRDPSSEFPRLPDRLHQRRYEVAVSLGRQPFVLAFAPFGFRHNLAFRRDFGLRKNADRAMETRVRQLHFERNAYLGDRLIPPIKTA